jgi:uncharacterized protein (DUF433 family)
MTGFVLEWEENAMDYDDLLLRISIDPQVCGGKPCIKGTRVYVATILDGLAEGVTQQEILEHYPQLTVEDVRAALAYAAELAKENVWKVAGAGE